jgi:hypothetical protein
MGDRNFSTEEYGLRMSCLESKLESGLQSDLDFTDFKRLMIAFYTHKEYQHPYALRGIKIEFPDRLVEQASQFYLEDELNKNGFIYAGRFKHTGRIRKDTSFWGTLFQHLKRMQPGFLTRGTLFVAPVIQTEKCDGIERTVVQPSIYDVHFRPGENA